MNAADPSRPGFDRAETEELARLLPATAEWELPPGRHLHHKDLLMQQIDHDRTTSPSATATPPRRRLLRPALTLPAVGLALAGALVVTTLSTGDHSPAPAAGTGTPHGAAVLLNRIAAASMETDTKPVKDGQFVYVRSLTRSNEGTIEGPVKLGATHKREVWLSQNPAPVTDIGLIREFGDDIPIVSAGADGSDDTGAVPAGIDRPTYAWLASLPTDPEALLQLLYRQPRLPGITETREEAVFKQIGSLLGETEMPARNSAALYKAVAKIPGVTETPDVVDAAGRKGFGITLSTATPTRSEWIFDKRSLAYLGSRDYLTKGPKGSKADTLYGSSAILQRAIVDQRGMEPAHTKS
jgi:hypothetical protein